MKSDAEENYYRVSDILSRTFLAVAAFVVSSSSLIPAA